MIRKLQIHDIDTIADIWLETNVDTHAFIDEDYWQDNYNMVKEMFIDAEIYVYENESEIKGFIGLNHEYIAGLFVLKEARSNGIGKQLIDYIKNIKDRLYLNVYQKNKRAIKFYEREGFMIQEEKIDESTGEKEFFMLWKR